MSAGSAPSVERSAQRRQPHVVHWLAGWTALVLAGGVASAASFAPAATTLATAVTVTSVAPSTASSSASTTTTSVVSEPSVPPTSDTAPDVPDASSSTVVPKSSTPEPEPANPAAATPAPDPGPDLPPIPATPTYVEPTASIQSASCVVNLESALAVSTATFHAHVVGGQQWVPEGAAVQKLGDNDYAVTLVSIVESNPTTPAGTVTVDHVTVDQWGTGAGSQVPHSIPVTPFSVPCPGTT